MSSQQQQQQSKKRVLVPVAHGSNEIEAVTLVSVLRKAGAEVTLAIAGQSDGNLTIEAFRGVRLVADRKVEDCLGEEWDMVALPGGDGATTLRDSEALTTILALQNRDKRLIGAICSAPTTVLASHKLLEGRTFTCLPRLRDQLPSDLQSRWVDEKVRVDEHIVTSQSPSSAMQFAVTLVGLLLGEEVATRVGKELEV